METRYGKYLNKTLPNMHVHLYKLKKPKKRTKSLENICFENIYKKKTDLDIFFISNIMQYNINQESNIIKTAVCLYS